MPHMACNLKSYKSASSSVPRSSVDVVFSSARGSWAPHQNHISCLKGRLPSWFLMAYLFVAYLGVVRRKEWPHFFRFHVVMGMLLEIALQVIGTVSRWMPFSVYWGKIGMHFWTAVAFAYLFTVLESMRCALAGMYADIPSVCDAAYIQIPYD